MGKRLKTSNLLLGLLLAAGLAGSAFEVYQLWHIERINVALKNGTPLSSNDYPFEQKFAAAWLQGSQRDYKRALQTYGQLLEMPLTTAQQTRVQYNIGNSLIEAVNVLGSLFYGVILGVFLVAFFIKKITSGHVVFWGALLAELLVLTVFILTRVGVFEMGFLWLNPIGAFGVILFSLLLQIVWTKKKNPAQ